MEQQLINFIIRYLGRGGTGDTPDNQGQCVGLIEVWLDLHHMPHIWGDAVDLLANADPHYYHVVPNEPTNAPPPGAIVCWDGTWGGGAGHTAIVLAATSMDVVVIEQNDPEGAPPLVATHDYSGIAGWIVMQPVQHQPRGKKP